MTNRPLSALAVALPVAFAALLSAPALAQVTSAAAAPAAVPADTVRAILRVIAQRASGPSPIKFVLQSGDAVVNGRDPKQWNVSFTGLINRLTTEGGVPYFLAPGNHDVTSAADLENPGRKEGLANYLRAVAQLIPPDGATRRLNGYPTYAFGYGNTFVLAFDSNIAADSVQFHWARTAGRSSSVPPRRCATNGCRCSGSMACSCSSPGTNTSTSTGWSGTSMRRAFVGGWTSS